MPERRPGEAVERLLGGPGGERAAERPPGEAVERLLGGPGGERAAERPPGEAVEMLPGRPGGERAAERPEEAVEEMLLDRPRGTREADRRERGVGRGSPGADKARSTLRDLAELVRAPAALSVPGDVIAGAVAAGRLGPRTAGLAAASVCLYWAGMAANDWADRDLDAVERPERPIPSGRVGPRRALAVAAGLTVAGVGIAALSGGRRAAAVAAPLAGAVWVYDLWAKNTAAGPPAMAVCRGLDVLLGAGGGIRSAVPAALTMAAHTGTVTVLSRREVSGAGGTLPAATLAATVALAGAVSRTRHRGSGAVTAALAGWYAGWFGRAQARAAADPSAHRVRAAVGAGITGMPLLQGALTARAGAPVAGLAVAAVAPVARRLTRRMSAT